MERRFELPPVALPDLRHERDPEPAAAAVRQHWGLGQQPIRNLVHLLESKGIRVFSLSIDAAHELGHLLLYRHAAPAGREAEAQADAFASAFLMPRWSILAHAPRFVTLDQLIRLKRIWTVSLSALTYRLHAVRLLSDWHYRGLCIEISQRGFRKSEPEEAPRESSQALAKVFAALRADGLTKNDVAAQVGVHPSEIDQFAFGLMLVSLTDTAGHGAVRRATTRARASSSDATALLVQQEI